MKLLDLIAHIVGYVTQDEQVKSGYNLEGLQNSPNYKSFVVNVIPEINRAIQEINSYRKIIVTSKESDEINVNNDMSYFNVFSYTENEQVVYMPSDFQELIKVTWLDTKGRECPLKANIRNGKIYYEKPKHNGSKGVVVIYYTPIINPLIANISDYYSESNIELSTIGITNPMCYNVIPMLVKANLWQEIEPELAQVERNKGLQNLSILPDADEWSYEQNEILLENDYE